MVSFARSSTLSIVTPEGVTFSYKLAGPLPRAMAVGIDTSVISAITMLASILTSILAILTPEVSTIVSIAFLFVFTQSYFIICEGFWRGQTPGKRLLGLRVMDERGLRLRFSQIILRNIMRSFDMMPILYTVGGISSLLNNRCKRLGDIVAGTVVIRESPVPIPDLDKLMADKYNSFRSHPHLEARLRQNVSPEEAGVALEAIMRREEFEQQARAQLFAALATRLRPRAEFPEETTFALTDEQYVRNVVDTLYRVDSRMKKATPAPP